MLCVCLSHFIPTKPRSFLLRDTVVGGSDPSNKNTKTNVKNNFESESLRYPFYTLETRLDRSQIVCETGFCSVACFDSFFKLNVTVLPIWQT